MCAPLYRLRAGYQKRKALGKCSRIWFTRKVYAKMCQMLKGKIKKIEVPTEPEICRCCGQTATMLVDLYQKAERLEWFLAFTGLTVEHLARPYTKICEACADKLAQAQKFHELCLVGDQIIQAELANVPPAAEPEPVEEAPFLEDIVSVAVEKPPRCCTVCGEMVLLSDFHYHMRLHEIEEKHKEQKCPFCDKTFTDQVIYKRHVEYHIDGQVHECTECPQKFNCIALLKKHKRVHNASVEPGYLCTICGKSYDTALGLKYHMNNHNGFKPFKCPHCGQLFARVHGLNTHIGSRHENVRYQCSYCDMKYIQSGKLKMHTLLRHQDAILRCDSCNLESTTLKR
jgi:uncharacterized C2H2 Zn-finger protein